MKYILITSLFFSVSLFGIVKVNEELSALPEDPKDLYIDLLKRTVANTIYDDKPEREEGKDWPASAHTMVGIKRLDNIEECIKNILESNTPGDFVETGAWRGGSTIFMRGILKAYNVTDRAVFVCDSFEGTPAPDTDQYPDDEGASLHLNPGLNVSLATVEDNFSKYGLLDNQVRFVKGYFKDTLQNAPIQNIALLRLDGDLYESTMDSLMNLYPKVVPGGYIIIDDMYNRSCVNAVNDYRSQMGISTPMKRIDWTGVYWQK